MPASLGFVASLSPAGAPLWARSIRGGNPIDVAATNDAHVFVAGVSNLTSVSVGSFTVPAAATNVGFVADLTATGTPVTLRASTGGFQTFFLSVAVSRDSFSLGVVHQRRQLRGPEDPRVVVSPPLRDPHASLAPAPPVLLRDELAKLAPWELGHRATQVREDLSRRRVYRAPPRGARCGVPSAPMPSSTPYRGERGPRPS